ncbi:nuclear transport factor 2 family protein [Rossellomorea aquimaris]|uniref:nuclear transport factor 2 family protein n=1 Tax=Rossellomorea aquimaris TaxID=189382 RepID=UPI0007D04D5D|nr:DUF4440 domain-containing protein [Rossellomorea aquimaris]
MKTVNLRRTIHDLELQLLNPETRSNPKKINTLLADGFFEFGSSGNIWVKKDTISEEGLSIRNMTMYDFDIRLLSDGVVLATYRVRDETRHLSTLRSSIWKWIDERWQMCFHQGTISR